MYPILFEEDLHRMVWGSESWMASVLPSSPSVIANGALAGQPLAKVWADFPLLFKIIDARQDLSIQVHPDDAMAQRHHGCCGKTEMWYIVSATPGASLYSGFSQEITMEEYERRVADGTICDVLARHEVHAGDVFFIPAGRPHSIGGGIVLAEVQQSCDITYRLFDYNRPGLDGKPRQLHTALAKEALDFRVHDDYRLSYTPCLNEEVPLLCCPQFAVNLLEVDSPVRREQSNYAVYMAVEGECAIEAGGHVARLTAGRCCLVPCAGEVLISGKATLLISE